MDINFKLNDRQNSNQLSDRIIDSADEVFKTLLFDDSVQKLLMKGEMTEKSRKIAQRRHKDDRDAITALDAFFIQCFNHLKTLTDDHGEKQLFENCILGMQKAFQGITQKNVEVFGQLDTEIANSPMIQPLYGHKMSALYYGNKGPFLYALMPVMSMVMVCDRVLDYLKQNPNYSPNNYTKVYLYEGFGFKQFYQTFRQMIDRRGDQVSEKEVKQLSEIFTRGVAFEREIQIHNYNLREWYEG